MMNRIKHNMAGIIFALLGAVFLYLDIQPAMDMSHMGHTGHNMKDMDHGTTLFGIGEMTWMWFSMAFVHFFLKDCNCNKCKG